MLEFNTCTNLNFHIETLKTSQENVVSKRVVDRFADLMQITICKMLSNLSTFKIVELSST